MFLLFAAVAIQVSAGGLLSEYEPHTQSLVGESPRVQLALGGAPSTMAPARSLSELRLELEHLEAAKPSIGGPIALLVSGGVLAIGGFVTGYLGLLVLVLGSPVLLYIGLGVLAAGIPLLVVGGVLLGSTLRERRAASREIEQVRREIRALESTPPPVLLPPAPGPDGLTPPPLPPPTGQTGPDATLLLAEF